MSRTSKPTTHQELVAPLGVGAYLNLTDQVFMVDFSISYE